MSRVHPVTGYPDNENMWVKLCNVEKTEINKNQFQNDKSVVTLQVSDRVFKLKKNPLYKDASRLAKLLEQYKPSGGEAGGDFDMEGNSSSGDNAGGACDSEKND